MEVTLHGRGTMVGTQKTRLVSKFHFNKDIANLYTAALLAETGMGLLEKQGKVEGCVITPAVALGSNLAQHIMGKMDTSFKIKEE
jgi:short subunit dehydrogenase-like uncharacterized protein